MAPRRASAGARGAAGVAERKRPPPAARAAEPELPALKQLEQGGYVSCLAVTYNAHVNSQTVRKLLASGSFENSIKLWDLDSGACVATLLPKDGTSALAFGPPGEQQRLVCGGEDRTLRQWRLPSLEEGRPMTGHRDAITDLCCPDARTVVSCGLDRTIHVWDADTGEQLASATNHCEIRCMLLRKQPSEQGPPYEDLAIVACGGKHEVMGLPRSEIMEHILVTPPAAAEPARASPPEFEESRNVSTRTCPTKPALEAPVSALATPRDGNGEFVVLGAFDGSVRVLPWGAANMDEAGVNRLYWATTGDRIDTVCVAAPVHAVACSPDGHWIASGDRRGNIHVWRYHGADARGHGRGFNLTYFSHAMGWEKQRKTQRTRRHSTGSIAAAAAVFGGGDGSGATPGPVAFAPRAPQMQPTEGSYCFERAHKGQVMALHITESLDLISSGCDGAVRVWDLRALVYAQRIAMARMRTLCRRREDAPAAADAAVAKRTRRGGVRAPGAAERALALACALPEDALFQKLVSFV